MHRWETTCECFKLTVVTIGPSNLNFPNKKSPWRLPYKGRNILERKTPRLVNFKTLLELNYIFHYTTYILLYIRGLMKVLARILIYCQQKSLHFTWSSK